MSKGRDYLKKKKLATSSYNFVFFQVCLLVHPNIYEYKS